MKKPSQLPCYRFCPMCSQLLGKIIEADGAVRQACKDCGWVFYPHVAISVSAVTVKVGRVLLVRRKYEPFPGSWMFPSGFLEYGELPATGVLRELREETGLYGRETQLIDMLQSEDDPREPNHLSLFFRVHHVEGTLANVEAENLAVCWFGLDKMPRMALRNHENIAKRIFEIL